MAANDAAGSQSEQKLRDHSTRAEKLNESDEERLNSAVEIKRQNETGSADEDDREEFYDAVDELSQENDEAVRTKETSVMREDSEETDVKNEMPAVAEQNDETDKEATHEQSESTGTLKEILDEKNCLHNIQDASSDAVRDEQINEVKELEDSPHENVGDCVERQCEYDKPKDICEGDGERDGDDNDDYELPDHCEETSDDKSKPKPSTLEEDEELLKDLESNMTDEEKEVRKQEAQEWKSKGNEFYQNEEYGEAIDAYVQALQICPLCYKKERAIMYSNRAACHLRMEEREEAIVDCSKALELHPVYVKALLRRAQTYEKVEKPDEALGDYQQVLELDAASYVAREACMRLPEEIKQRNEKLKEEMFGKLKDLGNLILRPFGLSTNNFQLQPNPETGAYSVNFQQNPENNGK